MDLPGGTWVLYGPYGLPIASNFHVHQVQTYFEIRYDHRRSSHTLLKPFGELRIMAG